MKHAIVMAAFLGLAACSTAPEPAAPSPTPTAPPPPVPPAPQPVADSCGAHDLQSLVGRPRSEIPVPVKPDLQRVACTTCAVTMDFNPNRLNFFFDAQTGLIKEVRCG
ncbi:MAG: peptidase inhibitor I78 [Alphaproteobacteria bacterium]|nr:peptidase inhibitor I78 [Alphaproteobacteria bacterium]MBU1513606.1 peptidase inhibitor I78 [Alphaproteobacteria bacterium]MBU2094749.1 peptidase inhibitor I78 [Alphaproteobacteria bacterium]MBU2150182.1 peptidase inhibitor I78 [Alphaproteobacteria bacterium]MBU2309289.1 peptidase inhibitor I78 [Alphaproteobacteria bacterium]